MKSSRKTTLLIAIFLLVFVTVILLISRTDSFVVLEKALQVQTVPRAILEYGPLGDILRKSRLVMFARNDSQRFNKTEDVTEDIQTITFQKKRKVDEVLVVANPSERRKFRSTVFAESFSQKTDWPIISIAVPEESLYDPDTGILVNRDKKGREWERLAEVTYIENGGIVFETYVGLRMHGGKRLTTGKWAPGFKLYFRKKFGLENVPKGVIFTDTEVPIRTLVLQTTVWPPGYPMNNPLAYDIARKIDCKVPDTRLVEIYVNGKSNGMGFAVEHLSRRQWGQRYGNEEYNFFKFRSNNITADEAMYVEKFWKIVTAKQDFSRDYAAANIDLDNFSRHVFSWVFSGTSDYCQGVAVYDSLEEEPKISWINWDMDHSFYDGGGIAHSLERENWQQPAFGIIYKKSHTCGRTTLFSRLMNEDEEFKLEFLNLVVELLNHRLTVTYLQTRVAYYKQMLLSYGKPHRDYIIMLEKFMANRTGFILGDIRTKFSAVGPFSCHISMPEEQEVLVDGYKYKDEYSGKYFTETPVSVALPAKDTDRLKYWLVNGRKNFDKALYLTLQKDTEIGYVLATSP